MSDQLTAREKEIAHLVALDLSDQEIARRLCIQWQTVKNAEALIRRKLGVASRLGIAVAVVRGEVAR